MGDGNRRRRRKAFFDGPFCGRAREMLESPAYRVLSCAAFMVMARLEIAHSYEASRPGANGKLRCTYKFFEEYGLHRDAVSPALRELAALGFVEVMHRGAGGNAEFRDPTLYRLTFLPTEFAGPTHEWRKFETVGDAKRAAKTSRSAANPAFVARGKKQNFAPGFRPVSPPESGVETPPRKAGVVVHPGKRG